MLSNENRFHDLISRVCATAGRKYWDGEWVGERQLEDSPRSYVRKPKVKSSAPYQV